MARIEGIPDRQAGLFARLAYFFSRRMFGRVLGPTRAIAHHGAVLASVGFMELGLRRARTVAEPLKSLTQIKAAMMIGCPF